MTGSLRAWRILVPLMALPLACVAAAEDQYLGYSGVATGRHSEQFLYGEQHLLIYRDGRLAERLVLVRNVGVVERGVHVEDGGFARLQQRIEPAQDDHWQDHVAVFSAHIEVAENIVGDVPNEFGDPSELRLIHASGGSQELA